MFQYGLDFCFVQQFGNVCPYAFMTCKKCPYSSAYRDEFYNKNFARFIVYSHFIY